MASSVAKLNSYQTQLNEGETEEDAEERLRNQLKELSLNADEQRDALFVSLKLLSGAAYHYVAPIERSNGGVTVNKGDWLHNQGVTIDFIKGWGE